MRFDSANFDSTSILTCKQMRCGGTISRGTRSCHAKYRMGSLQPSHGRQESRGYGTSACDHKAERAQSLLHRSLLQIVRRQRRWIQRHQPSNDHHACCRYRDQMTVFFFFRRVCASPHYLLLNAAHLKHFFERFPVEIAD